MPEMASACAMRHVCELAFIIGIRCAVLTSLSLKRSRHTKDLANGLHPWNLLLGLATLEAEQIVGGENCYNYIRT
jgi:hypothetical protein